jgi:hypothetical protein
MQNAKAKESLRACPEALRLFKGEKLTRLRLG